MIHSGETLQESIYHQREALMGLLQEPLQRVAESCVSFWHDRDALDAHLLRMLQSIPYGKSLYALDENGIQLGVNGARMAKRDLSRLCRIVPGFGALLSDAYISANDRLPGVTAIQMVRDSGGSILGFIGTDFDLHDLPLTGKLYKEPVYWRQLKGDPSIRDTVFHQNRAESDMDRRIDVVLGVIGELMIYHGVYHVMLHFSSSRAVIWVLGDPYRYRLLDIDALIDPDICLAYPRMPYPDNALVPSGKLHEILDAFRNLRYMDETFYLRSGTLNIFNGVVGLTFSCDGSHYIPFEEFLEVDLAFWT